MCRITCLQALHQKLQVHGKTGIAVAFAVKADVELLLYNGSDFFQHIQRGKHCVQVAAFQLRADNMQSDAAALGFRQRFFGMLANNFQRPQPQLIFLRVQVLYIECQRHGQANSLLLSLDGKGNMVCQGKRKIRIQIASQADFRLFYDIGRSKDHILRKAANNIKIFRVNIIKCTIDNRHIGKLIGKLAKADPTPQNDHFTASLILCHCCIVVDPADDFQNRCPPF